MDIPSQLHSLRFCFCSTRRNYVAFVKGNCFAQKLCNKIKNHHIQEMGERKYWKKILLMKPCRNYVDSEVNHKSKILMGKFNLTVKRLLQQHLDDIMAGMTTEESSAESQDETSNVPHFEGRPENHPVLKVKNDIVNNDQPGEKQVELKTGEDSSCQIENQRHGDEKMEIENDHVLNEPRVKYSVNSGGESSESSEIVCSRQKVLRKKRKFLLNKNGIINESSDEDGTNVGTVAENEGPKKRQKFKKKQKETNGNESENSGSSTKSEHSRSCERQYKEKKLHKSESAGKSTNKREIITSSTSSSDNESVTSSSSDSSSSDSRSSEGLDGGGRKKDVSSGDKFTTSNDKSNSNFDNNKTRESSKENVQQQKRSKEKAQGSTNSDSSQNDKNFRSKSEFFSSSSSSSESTSDKSVKSESLNIPVSKSSTVNNNSKISRTTKSKILNINPKSENLTFNPTFKIIIPSKEWEKVWNYDNFKFLPETRYAEIINEELRKLRPSIVFVAGKGKKINKNPSEKSKIFINLNGKCGFKTSESACPVTVILHCVKAPKKNHAVKFNVKISGKCSHKGEEFYSRRVTGTKRNELKNEMEILDPKDLDKREYNESSSKEMQHKIRPIGINVAAQLRYEKRKEGILDNIPIKELKLQKESLQKFLPQKPYPGFVHSIGDFYFTMYSSIQLLTLKDLALKSEFLELHFDSTGSIFKTNTDVDSDNKNKPVYLYSIVTKGPSKKSILPIFEFASSEHSYERIRELTVSCYLKVDDVFKKFGVPENKIKRITTDFSFALIKTSISCFNNNLKIGEYLEEVQKYVHGLISTTTIQVIVTLCISHLVKSYCVLLKSKGVDKSKRQIALHCFVNLIHASSFDEFRMVFEKFCTIFESKLDSAYNNNLIREMTGKEKINDDEIENFREENYRNLESEVNGPSKKLESKSKKRKLLREFTFYTKKLTQSRERAISRVNDEESDGEGQNSDGESKKKVNPLFCTKVIDALMKTYVPVIPLWAQFCHIKFSPSFTSSSNGLVEKHFSNVKQSKTRSRLTPGEFVKLQAENIQSSVRKMVATECRVIKQRKKKSKSKENIPSDDEKENSKRKRNDIHDLDDEDVEIWKPKKTKAKYGKKAGLQRSKLKQETTKKLSPPPGSSHTLTEAELSIISNQKLISTIVQKAQSLIHIKFPNFSGLQDPGRFLDVHKCPKFQSTDEIIQILFDKTRGHWILVVANLFTTYNVPTVLVLDSACDDVSHELQMILSSAFEKFVIDGTLHVQFLECDRQQNKIDCGVHCIANAFQVAVGKLDFPNYNHKDMRQHLVNILSLEEIKPFPSTPKPRPRPLHSLHTNCIEVETLQIPPPKPTTILDTINLDGIQITQPDANVRNSVGHDHDYLYSEPSSSAQSQYYDNQERVQQAYIELLKIPEGERKCKVCEQVTNSLANCWQCRSFVHGFCGQEEDFADPYSPFICYHCRE